HHAAGLETARDEAAAGGGEEQEGDSREHAERGRDRVGVRGADLVDQAGDEALRWLTAVLAEGERGDASLSRAPLRWLILVAEPVEHRPPDLARGVGVGTDVVGEVLDRLLVAGDRIGAVDPP